MNIETQPKILAQQFTVQDSVMKTLWSYINNAKDKANYKLVGQIEKEYNIDDAIPYVRDFFYHLILSSKLAERELKMIARKWRTKDDKRNLPDISLEELWVNFQKKHEYNPPHFHSGLFSFVIFMKIPFNIEDEKKVINNKDARSPLNGNFCLYDFNIEAFDYNFEADKTYEGTGFLFSSDQVHAVHPFFTSDEERITVSGNIYFK